MNWDAISAIAEVVGLIIIVASLIYIGVQTKQANDHATASSEISFIEGVNTIFEGWASDERTATIIRMGFHNFGELGKAEQALFQSRVGALINQLLLAEELSKKNLLSQEIADEVKKLTIAVLTTDGGLEYWEHDSKLTPGGQELLALAKELKGEQPNITELIPWWRSE